MTHFGLPVVATPSAPLRIAVDHSGYEYWHKREFEKLFEAISRGRSPDAVLVDTPKNADCVLRILSDPALNQDKLFKHLRWPKQKTPREFVWDYGDLPTGLHPGFYASLPSYMFDSRRHRAFPIPLNCNELMRPYDLADATHLYGFFGAITSGVRGRMVARLRELNHSNEGLIEVRDSIWNQMFDRSGLQSKVDYAEAMRRCRFNLCPKGNVLAGAGSRLYETMQAARVPVLISDWITLPEGIDWDSCAVRIREKDLARIPDILRGRLDEWETLAMNARKAWEAHFCEEALLGEIGRQLKSMLAWDGEDKLGTRLGAYHRISLGLFNCKARQALIRLYQMRRR